MTGLSRNCDMTYSVRLTRFCGFRLDFGADFMIRCEMGGGYPGPAPAPSFAAAQLRSGGPLARSSPYRGLAGRTRALRGPGTHHPFHTGPSSRANKPLTGACEPNLQERGPLGLGGKLLIDDWRAVPTALRLFRGAQCLRAGRREELKHFVFECIGSRHPIRRRWPETGLRRRWAGAPRSEPRFAEQ